MLKKIFIRLFMEDFLPVETVAELNEVEPINILNIYYKNKNDERFKIIDNKLCVISNYAYPFANELNEWREKALIIASNENTLCRDLAQMSGINAKTLQKYFYRFTFKQVKTAKKIIALLKVYTKQNSLFPVEELSYD